VTEGYQVIARVLTEAECDRLIAELQETTRSRAGARHLMSNRAVRAIANDDRLVSIARPALGGRAVPFRATLFEKSGAKNWLIAWHQDTALPLRARFDAPGWGPWSEKHGVLYAHAPAWALQRVVALRVHLDASTPENGPLRVVPESHQAGVLNDCEVLDIAKSRTEVECPVPRGGVLAMRPLLIHSSSKCSSDKPRRVLHIEYADCLEFAPGLDLAVV
jgi:ectoine hydroxylase-related dioxygenase (phytanoyl-CoA dioxygenase family)